jgi:hypothetical protein
MRYAKFLFFFLSIFCEITIFEALTKVMKKKFLFFAGFMFVAWITTSCEGQESCGFCRNVTYDNGVKTNESKEIEYCGADLTAQKTKQDVTIGSLVTKTECR